MPSGYLYLVEVLHRQVFGECFTKFVSYPVYVSSSIIYGYISFLATQGNENACGHHKFLSCGSGGLLEIYQTITIVNEEGEAGVVCMVAVKCGKPLTTNALCGLYHLPAISLTTMFYFQYV